MSDRPYLKVVIVASVLFGGYAAFYWTAGFGLLGEPKFGGGDTPTESYADVDISEHPDDGYVEIVVSDPGVYYAMNVTTSSGGGTGEFLDNLSNGDRVRLKAVDDPEWTRSGDGEYDREGDVVYLTGYETSNETRRHSYSTEPVSNESDG